MLKFLIYGSCISRDCFEFSTRGDIHCGAYFARSSVASAFYGAKAADNYSDLLTSKFQRKIVSADFKKDLPIFLAEEKYDYILVDFIDERFDLFVTGDGEVVTLSNELKSTGFLSSKKTGRVIKSGSEEFYQLWDKGWQTFIEVLKSNQVLSKMILIKTRWAHNSTTGLSVGLSRERINKENSHLIRLYKQAERYIDRSQIVEIPDSLIVADPNHKWGISPYHYIKDFYLYVLQNVRLRVGLERHYDFSADTFDNAGDNLVLKNDSLDDYHRKIRELAKKKAWSAAQEIYKCMSKEKDDAVEGHLIRQVKRVNGSLGEFKRCYIYMDNRINRLSSIKLDLDFSKVFYLGTEVVSGGLISICCFKHIIILESGEVIRIFEKVVLPERKKSVERESLLFDKLEAEVLLAPKYYGYVENHGFYSIFYEYIDGTGLGSSDFYNKRFDICCNLWQIPVSEFDGIIDVDYSPEVIDHYISALNTSNFSAFSFRDLSDLRAILTIFRSKLLELPRCVVHRDFAYGNVMVGVDGEPYLIDWDKWGISYVGDGLFLKPKELAALLDSILLDPKARKLKNVDNSVLLFSIYCFSLLKVLDKLTQNGRHSRLEIHEYISIGKKLIGIFPGSENSLSEISIMNYNKVVIGFVRFSIFTETSGGSAFASGKKSLNELAYKDHLFSEERMSARFRLFEDFLISSFSSMEVPEDIKLFKLVVVSSVYLPDVYKNVLSRFESKHSWLSIRYIDEKRGSLRAEVGAVLNDYCSDRDMVFTFRVDDDDALSRDYVTRVSQYLAPAFSGFGVSFASGYTGYYDLEERNILEINKTYYPKIALGLGLVDLYKDKRCRTVFDMGNHTKVDFRYPVIVDSTFPAFFRTLHLQGDQFFGADDIKAQRRRDKWKSELVPFSEVIRHICLSNDLVKAKALAEDITFEYEVCRVNERVDIKIVDVRSDLDVMYAVYHLRNGVAIKKFSYQNDNKFELIGTQNGDVVSIYVRNSKGFRVKKEVVLK